MKGKELTIDEIKELKNGEKVWVESYGLSNYNDFVAIVDDFMLKINIRPIFNLQLLVDNPYQYNQYIKLYKWIGEESKQYYGDEILKLIREGKLKEGTELINEKEPECMIFDEARKSGDKIKYKTWDKFMLLDDVLECLFTNYTDKQIHSLMDEKSWEVEN